MKIKGWERAMTKKELAKQERETKISFVNSAYSYALAVIANVTKGSRSNLDLRIKHKGGNRYINMSIYGSKLSLLVYQNGNVAIQLKEACHSDFETVLFEYTGDFDSQYEFLAYMEDYFEFLVEIFTGDGIVDPHTFMDYISCKKELISAIEAVREEWNPEDTEPGDSTDLSENL